MKNKAKMQFWQGCTFSIIPRGTFGIIGKERNHNYTNY